jgi:hypothetical protein
MKQSFQNTIRTTAIIIAAALCAMQWLNIISNISHIAQYEVEAAGVGEAYPYVSLIASVVGALGCFTMLKFGTTKERVVGLLLLLFIIVAFSIDVYMFKNNLLRLKMLDGDKIFINGDEFFRSWFSR